MASPGNGPVCPVDPSHKRLYSWERGSRSDVAWFCPSSAHGANGKFFTDKEAHGGYELEERDVTALYESSARDVIAGRVTLDQAVLVVARQTKRSSSTVREALAIMIDTIQEKDTDMAQKKAAARAATKTRSAAKPAGERRRLEHVEGSEFARVQAEYGLTSKQAAEATGQAEERGIGHMGASSTYIYILTHEGSSVVLFKKFEAALKAYAKDNGIKRPRKAKSAAADQEPAEDAVAETVDEAGEVETDVEADEDLEPEEQVGEPVEA